MAVAAISTSPIDAINDECNAASYQIEQAIKRYRAGVFDREKIRSARIRELQDEVARLANERDAARTMAGEFEAEARRLSARLERAERSAESRDAAIRARSGHVNVEYATA